MAGGDFEVKLGGDGTGLDNAVKKNAETVKELRKQLQQLRDQSIGLSKVSDEFKNLSQRATALQKELTAATRVGKDKNDVFQRLGKTMAGYALGVTASIASLSKMTQVMGDAIRANADMTDKMRGLEAAQANATSALGGFLDKLDDASGFTKNLNIVLTAAGDAMRFVGTEAKYVASAISGIIIASSGALAALQGLAGVIEFFGGGETKPTGMTGVYDRLKGGVEKRVRERGEELRGRIDYNVAAELERQKRADSWRGYFPYVSGNNFPPRIGPYGLGRADRLGMPDPRDFVGIPPQVDRPNLESKYKQRSIPELQNELMEKANEKQKKFNTSLLTGASQFVSIMGRGLIRLGDSFADRLVRGALAFMSIMLKSQGGPLGFLFGSLLEGVAAAGGADFTTSGPTLLMVGDNPGGRERVRVDPLSGRGTTRRYGNAVAMAGGGSISTMPSGNTNITTVANVDVYLGDRRLVKNIDYGIRSRAKQLNDRRGVPT